MVRPTTVRTRPRAPTRPTTRGARGRRAAAGAVVAALCVVATTGARVLVGRGPDAEPVLITAPSWTGVPGALTGPTATEVPLPGAGTRWSDMTAAALADLHRLTDASGAVAAGAADRWDHLWPRDSAFVAVALARSGEHALAETVLERLATLPFDAGRGYEARYTLDGAGPPDDRPRQLDGAGWYLWALAEVDPPPAPPDVSPAQRQRMEECLALVLRLTGDGRRLPPPSPDYWEVPEHEVTLGTVAPLVLGLRSAARLGRALGEPVPAARADLAARRLSAAVFERFGGSWQREGRTGGLDAAVAFVMPPFAPETPDAEAAWEEYQAVALRPAGGLAPGQAWRRDGVSWTPETALVAWTAAASGRRDLAAFWLDWLEAHRTAWGSLPEKVTASGDPAGPAPLAWTAALVVLAAAALGPAG